MAKLSDGVAVLKVGGTSNGDVNEKEDNIVSFFVLIPGHCRYVKSYMA